MRRAVVRLPYVIALLALMTAGGLACGRSQPPLPTQVPLPTYTPLPTHTPQTPLPTYPPLPTHTPLAPLPTYTPLPTHTPLPTYTPYPTPTHTPSPTPTPTPSVGTRENPVPFGAVARTHAGWEVSVLSATPNANDAVLAENRFNDPPRLGRQFYLVTLRAKYVGAGSDDFGFRHRLRVVGSEKNVVYEALGDGCGVIPDSLLTPEVFTGGVINGNKCWEMDSSDADSLVMFLGSGAKRIWFALK